MTRMIHTQNQPDQAGTNDPVVDPNTTNEPAPLPVYEEFIADIKKQEVDGVVLYCDGGCRQVNGHMKAGVGIHGYFYKDQKPKKGHGALLKATKEGYFNETPSDAIVDVKRYYDYSGPCDNQTNNVGELVGLTKSVALVLDVCKHRPLKKVLFCSDSKYVIDGLTQWLSNWIRNNWTKSDGQQVANKGYWLRLKALWDELEELSISRSIDVNIKWVKGHEDPGNIRADYNASVAVFSGNIAREEFPLATSDYWNKEYEHSKLLIESRLYYIPGITSIREGEDTKTYLLFSYPATKMDSDQIGKRVSEVSCAVVKLKQANETLENVIKRCEKFVDNYYDVPMIVRLDNALHQSNQFEILEGLIFHYDLDRQTQTLKSLNKDVLIEVLKPPRLSYRLYDEYTSLERVIKGIVNNEPQIKLTPINHIFYEETTTKKGKTETKMILKTENSFKVPVSYYTSQGDKVESVTVTLGIDAPKRRVFSAIADHNPKIYVVTWHENDNSFHYGIYIETDEGKGLWAAVYSGIHFVLGT